MDKTLLKEKILSQINISKENEAIATLTNKLAEVINNEKFYIDEVAEVCYILEFVSKVNKNQMQQILTDGKNKRTNNYSYLLIRQVCGEIRYDSNPKTGQFETGEYVDDELSAELEKWCEFIEDAINMKVVKEVVFSMKEIGTDDIILTIKRDDITDYSIWNGIKCLKDNLQSLEQAEDFCEKY